MKTLLVFLLLFGGQASAADSSVVAPDFLSFLKQIAEFTLNNPAITAPLTVWVLALIPGQFRGISQAVLGWLLEQLKSKLAAHAVRSAFDGFRPDLHEGDEKQEMNNASFDSAFNEAVSLGIPKNEADTRVRSAFRELKAKGEVK